MCPHCLLVAVLTALGSIPIIGGVFLCLRYRYWFWRSRTKAKEKEANSTASTA